MKHFYKIPLTEDVITKLGFGEYWGDCGDSGTRSLTDPEDLNKGLMRIHEIDQQDDCTAGYGTPEYTPHCFTTDKWEYLYFIHELLEDAENNWPDAVEILKSNMKKYHMWYAIESYYKAKEEENDNNRI